MHFAGESASISIAHKIESLVKLEAKYGPLSGFSPAVDDVLEYLKQVSTRVN